MKTTNYLSIVAAVGIIGITTVQAQTLTPLPIQQPDMPTLIQGLTELALNATNEPFTGTAIVSDSSEINGFEGYHVIDGLYNVTAYPWANEPELGYNAITASDGTNAPWLSPDHPSSATPFPDVVIIDFTGTNATTVSDTLGMVVLEGRYASRGAGTYTLQYTTDTPPLGIFSDWTTIGTYTWANANPLPEVAFTFSPIPGVTGFQLQSLPDPNYNGTNTSAGAFWANSIQQIGLYAPPTNAPVIVNQPQGTNAYVGYTVTLDAGAIYGTQFQWYKNNSLIGGATSNTLVFANAQTANSGTYKVVVQNSFSSITSSNAVVNITTLPPTRLNEQTSILFAWTNLTGYAWAVQGSANPGGPYTTITNWTVNVGNLVETAIPTTAVPGDKFFQLSLISHP
jgi:hypothetical protein